MVPGSWILQLEIILFLELFEDDSLDQEGFHSILPLVSSSPNIPRLPEPTPNIEIEEAPIESASTETKTEKPNPNSPEAKSVRKSTRSNAGEPPVRYPDTKSVPKKEEL